MTLTVLVENTACREGILPQHGLSLYLQTQDQRILFDMGQDTVFLQNARNLGVDLSQVDLAVISHGHYDHGGGLAAFLSVNPGAPIYLHKEAFGAYYNGTEKYIGLDAAMAGVSRLRFTEGSVLLMPNLLLTDGNDLGWENNSWGLNRKEGNTFLPDPFRHEQYLQITEAGKRILISGCSHKGIGNIARHFQPDVLIGGFHMSKEEDPAVLRKTAECLLSLDTRYYTGHCTGEKQYALLKGIMGDRLERLSAGTVLEV